MRYIGAEIIASIIQVVKLIWQKDGFHFSLTKCWTSATAAASVKHGCKQIEYNTIDNDVCGANDELPLLIKILIRKYFLRNIQRSHQYKCIFDVIGVAARSHLTIIGSTIKPVLREISRRRSSGQRVSYNI